MRLAIDVSLDYRIGEPCDVLLAVEVAQLPDQSLIDDLLTVDGSGPLHPVDSADGIGRRTWLTAGALLRLGYRATVDVDRPSTALDDLEIAARRDLPPQVLSYLWPSRYCEADRFESFVERRFGGIAGGGRIAAMAEWIRTEMAYVPGSSDSATTAADAFVARRGVCRDYAHLMASFARAAGVPARLVSAYAPDIDPPDFHAVVEVWLGGDWRIVDATGMARADSVVRICAGRDATDIAFLTSFGPVEMIAQSVGVARIG